MSGVTGMRMLETVTKSFGFQAPRSADEKSMGA
jgi:hypothetical protein